MSRTAFEDRTIESSPTAESTRPEAETVLAVEDLQKTYGDGKDAVEAVEDFSVEVNRGEVVGLLGPNGAGKTTAIKSILGAGSSRRKACTRKEKRYPPVQAKTPHDDGHEGLSRGGHARLDRRQRGRGE